MSTNAPEKEQDKLIETINKRWTIGRNFLKPYLENFTRYYKIYRSYVNDDKTPTKHKVFNPYLFSAVETATSKAVANKPKGSFSPKTPDDNPDTEEHNQLFDHYYNVKDEQMFLKTAATFKKGLMYGTAVGEVFWRYEMGFRDGKQQVVSNRPAYRLLNLENGEFVFDPEAECLDQAKWFIKKETWTKTDIENIKSSPFSKQFQDLDKVLEAFDRMDFDNDSFRQEHLKVNGSTDTKDETISKVDVLHEYSEGKIRTLVGKKFLVRDIPNPYLFNHPFVSVIDHIVPNELLGMGEIEPTERLQHTLNTIENQRRDNVALVINRMWLNTPRGADDEGELVSAPGAIINVKDLSGIQALDTPDVTSSSYNEAESIKSDIQNALSISNFSKGTDEVDTAGKSGVAIGRLQSAADARIQTKMQLFEEMFIKQVAEKWLKLIYQYGDQQLSVRITGKQGQEWKTVDKQSIAGEYDYEAEAGSTQHTDKGQARVEFTEFMNTILMLADKKSTTSQPQVDPATGQPMPQAQPVINYDKLAETLADKYGIKNFDEIWIQPQAEPAQPTGEMLPSAEMQARPKDYGQGEMLPSIETANPNAGRELLPSIQ
jgi:hypothetical protein